MNVSILIRVPVMTPMMGGPPERAFLKGHRSQNRKQELNESTRPEAAMREVAMISRCQSEHPYCVQTYAQKERGHADANE